MITATTAAGIAATLFSMAMGVVFVDMTLDAVNHMGESLKSSALSLYGEESTTYSNFLTWIDGLTIEKDSISPVLSIDEEFRPIVQHWGAQLMKGEGVEVEGEAAPDGYAYYNGYCLPTVIDISTRPYHLIFYGSDGLYYDVQSATPVKIYDLSTDYYINSIFSEKTSTTSTSAYLYYLSSSQSWYVDNSWGDYSSFNIWKYSNRGSYTLIWANHDIIGSSGSVVFSASPDPLTQEKTIVYPSTYVGDMPLKIQQGEADEEDIPVPNEIDYSKIFEGQTDAVEALNNVATQLADGIMTYDDYLEMTKVGTSSDVGTGDDTDSDVVDVTGTLGGTEAATFFDKLVAIIAAPFEWIWSKIEVLFGPWIESIGTWFSEIGAKIEAIPAAFAGWFENIISGIEAIPGAFAGWFSDVIEGVLSIPAAIGGVFEDVIAGVISLRGTIYNGVITAIEFVFVPSEGYVDAKIEALTAEYAFADSIAKTGVNLKGFLLGLGSQPPIIYIDLGASNGSYNIGGKTVFIDLTWYAQYKGTMDLIISAFLWLWFAWRMLLSLPGIIQGTSGFWSKPDPLAGFTPWAQPPARLESGDRLSIGTSEYHSRGNEGRHYTRHDGY